MAASLDADTDHAGASHRGAWALGRALQGLPHVVVERPDDGLGDVPPAVQDAAVPLRRRVPCPRRRRRHRCATSPSTSTASSAQGARPRRRPRRHGALRRSARSAGGPRKNIARMAEQFIVGSHAGRGGRPGCTSCGAPGSAATVDLLGEKTVVEAEADRYQRACCELLGRSARCGAVTGRPTTTSSATTSARSRASTSSIKPTALATHYEPLSRDEGSSRPRRGSARSCGWPASAARTCTSTWSTTTPRTSRCTLFRDLLDEHEFADVAAGIVIQAYLRDARDDLADLIAWSSGRPDADHVRLVKGAYWDAETVQRAGRAAGRRRCSSTRTRPTPSYERCVRLLHDHHGEVRAAFGSHNLRSLAYAVSYAADQRRARPRLRGPAALRDGRARCTRPSGGSGLRLRVYAPGRRARARHGVPRAPAAREHVATRASSATGSPRAARSTSSSPRRRSTTSPVPPTHPSCAPTDPGDPDAIRARAAARVAAGGRRGRRSRVAVDAASATASVSTSPP